MLTAAAPRIIALFGEKFAQQYMSEAFSWLDYIIFSMAPLGIITSIVGAIRVGGPPWMRALVGRARENVATAELELMSSTSHEVCEVFNGKAIVRSIGRPQVKQIIVIPSKQGDRSTFGLYTLDDNDTLQSEGSTFKSNPLALAHAL